MAELYALALDRAPAGAFYYVENGEASFAEAAAAIARRLGLDAPQPWPIDDAIATLGFGHAVYSLGSNSRVRGRRARAELDWSPKHASLTGWIENDAGALMRPARRARATGSPGYSDRLGSNRWLEYRHRVRFANGELERLLALLRIWSGSADIVVSFNPGTVAAMKAITTIPTP